MKKYMSLLLLAITLILLSACGDNIDYTKLMISVYLEGTDNNKSIEIYNSGDTDVSLSDFNIGIYQVGDEEPSNKISLEGTLKAKECYVVSHSGANQDILSKTNLKTDNLSFAGKEGIALLYKKTVVDVIGTIGMRNDMRDITYVRKVDMTTPSTTFDLYNFIIYNCDNSNYLGEFINSVTPEELLEGPKFDPKYLDIDFFKEDPLVGLGGAVEVTLSSNVDGDTSYFAFTDDNITNHVASSSKYTVNGVTSAKVRYQDINTPETTKNNIMEFGWPAKLYTAELQNKADKIYVQTVKNDSFLCTYGRIMGYVFVCNGDDSKLVNYEIIKKGYSTISFEYNKEMTYKDIPYYGYMMNAKLYAEKNKLGLNGEIDPYWDYTKDQSIYA